MQETCLYYHSFNTQHKDKEMNKLNDKGIVKRPHRVGFYTGVSLTAFSNNP